MRSRRCQRQRLSRQAKLCFAESMHAQTAMIENGFVHLPEAAAWLAQYLHELTVFPHGKRDDQVESTPQMLDWYKQASGPTTDRGVFELHPQLAEEARGQHAAPARLVRLRAPRGVMHLRPIAGTIRNVAADGTV